MLKKLNNNKVTPMYWNRESKKLTPTLKWKTDYDSLPTLGELDRREFPSCAILTGAGEPCPITVIDLDKHGKDDGVQLFKDFCESNKIVIKTPQVATPNNGFHLYFEYCKELVNGAYNGIDIRNDGGIITAPNSSKPKADGEQGYYKLLNPQTELQKLTPQEGAVIQQFLSARVGKGETKKAIPASSGSKLNVEKYGGRNNAMFVYLKDIYRITKIDKDELFALAELQNRLLPEGLPEEEIRTIIDSVVGYGAEPYFYKDGSKTVFSMKLFVENLMDKYPMYRRGNVLYVYNEASGYYKGYNNEDKDNFYLDNMDEEKYKAKSSFLTEFNQFANRLPKKMEFPEDTTRYICCNNGIFDTKEKELLDFNPGIRLEAKFKGTYNPNYKKEFATSAFYQWLSTTFPADDLLTVQHILGYCLAPCSKRVQTLILLSGDGSNGKSVFQDIIMNMFEDKELISNQRIKDFEGQGGFGLAPLEGKHIILSQDENFDNLSFGDMFKKVVAGDRVNVNVKNEKQKDMNFNLAVLVSCNKLPNNSDKSFGLARRFFTLPFTKTFTDNVDDIELGLADGVKNFDMVQHIFEYEMDIVFNWALDGLIDLQSKGYSFHQSKNIKSANEEVRRNSDAVFAFVTDCLERTREKHKYDTKVMYEDFLNYCANEGYEKPIGIRAFNAQMKNSYKSGIIKSSSKYYHTHYRKKNSFIEVEASNVF